MTTRRRRRPARRRGSTRRARTVWEHWHWLVIAGLAVVAFWLGVWGFGRYHDALEDARSFWDNCYSSLQLFGLEFGDTEPPIPWQIQVARILGPAVAITAALSAVAAIFRDQLARLYVRQIMSDHVVVCGLGRCGATLARGFRTRGFSVVGIEARAAGHDARRARSENVGVEASRDEGVVVLDGDAVDAVRRGKAGVERAAVVVAVCGDDGVNAEVAIAAREALGAAHGPRRWFGSRRARRRHHRPLECFVHIDDPDLCRLLEEARPPLPSVDDHPMALDFFNPSENAAPALLAEHPVVAADGESWSAPARMLVVGLDQMGGNVLVHAARCWRALHGPNGPVLPVTVVDREAKKRIDTLADRHPRISDVCKIEPLPIDVQSAEFDTGAFLSGADGEDDVTCAYVCLDEDARGLGAALAIHRALAGRRVPIVVRAGHRSGLAALLHETQIAEEYANLHAFGLVDRVCRPEVLLDEKNELLARAIHERYVRRERAAGETPATNPNMVDWDRLPEEIRESNRNQAAHTATKLRAIRCAILPLQGWDSTVVLLTPDEIETMARLEHDRWRVEREGGGWTRGAPRDVKRKIHPALVPWEQLPEDVREDNRDIVRGLPAFLVAAGFLIVRADVWEVVARATHEDYVHHQRLEGQTPQTNPSMVDWDALPETLKSSNRDQARHIGEKLAAVGCTIVPMTDRNVVPAVFSRDELELLAMMEHERWWREREADGWAFAPDKDVERKHSPYLVPFDELPEPVKEYDRNAVRGIPAFVARAGFAVVRVDG